MPEKLILEILKSLIPLQEVNLLLSKIINAAVYVSKADRCLILRYDFEKKEWKNIIKYPEAAEIDLKDFNIYLKETQKPYCHNKKSKKQIKDTIPNFPFCTIPLMFPSLNSFYGLLYVDRHKAMKPFTKKIITELQSFANLASLCLENDMLFEKANIDELTKAYTKSFFLTRLEEEFQRSLRLKSSFGLFMCDVDDFKRINDTYGHLKGDFILKKFVESVKKYLRIYDVIGRFGGDEFIILLPGLESSNLYNVAKKIQEGLSKVDFDVPEPVTFSFGGISYPFHSGKDIQDLILQADMALYSAKEKGKGRVIVLGRETPILSPHISQVPKYLTAKIEVKEFFQNKDLIFQIMKEIEKEVSLEKKERLFSQLEKLKNFLDKNFSF